MYQGARFFFFWGQWVHQIFVVLIVFPLDSQHVPQVPNVFLISLHFVSIFFAKLSSTLDLTHISNSKEEITRYLIHKGPKFYIIFFVL
jgi:hypothetical protein